MIKLLKAVEQPKALQEQPSGLKFNLGRDLYPYQREDVEKMMSGGSWLNFSEMGVGKTPETLSCIEKMGFNIPLIICPNSLRLEWKRQIDEWIGEDLATVSSWDKIGPIIYSFQNGQKYRIINYEALRKKEYVELLNMIPFDCIVFDEIHKTRNPKTALVFGKEVKGTRLREGGLWEFMKAHKDAKVIGLSGSPIMNYPGDLYVPLSLVRPERWNPTLGDWRQFMYHYCYWADGQYGPYVYGTRNMDELRKLTQPFIIRRTKKEVLPYLPEKYFRRVHLEMQPDQRKLYKEMEEQLRILLDTGEPLWSTNVLSTLTRLRQINVDPKMVGVTCSSAKTDFIIDTIESTDEKIVLFTCFEKYVEVLSMYLEKSKIPYVTITGQVTPNERSARVKAFQEDPNIKICLGTIQTMGEGITLTAASNVILADRWWNQPVVDQAIDRCHRIGQRNKVQVIIPICLRSVDAVLDEILERKDQYSNSYYQENVVRKMVIEERGLNR